MKIVRYHFSLDNLRRLLILVGVMTIAAHAQSLSWVRASSSQGSGDACNQDQCDDLSYAVKVGPDGSQYIAGRFSGTAQFAGTTLVSAGGLDMFVARYGRSGKLLWIVQAGGSSDDFAESMDVDKAGNIYVVGMFNNTAVFGSTDGAAQTVTGGTVEETAFLAKYRPSGALVWVQTGVACCVGTVNRGFGIAVNSRADTVYLISVSQGDVVFSSANGTSSTVPGVGTWHMVLAKYDTRGNFQWGQVNEAAPNSIPDGVAVDANDNAYVTGWLEDTTVFYSNDGHNITVTGFSPGQTTFDYPDDCFLAKYDKYGNARWVNLVGGYKCNGSTVAVSHAGEVTMVGYFGNINFGSPGEAETIVTSQPPGKNVTLRDGVLTNPYTRNGLIATYDAAGVLRRVHRVGGDRQQVATGVAYDHKGNLYVSGVYEGAVDPQNLFVLKFSGNRLVWKKTAANAGVWVGNNTIISPAVAVDREGRVFVTGAYQSTASFGNITLYGTGAADIFLAELAPD